MGYVTALVACSVEGCPATHKGGYWESVKAHDAGWFEQKDGTVYCPEHGPEWLAEWRARKKASGR